VPAIVKKKSPAGVGCAIQGLGCAALILGAVLIWTIWGPVVFGLAGLSFLVWGSALSVWWECSDCGTKLAGKHVKVCPACSGRFGEDEPGS
jgi:hypothetical protein